MRARKIPGGNVTRSRFGVENFLYKMPVEERLVRQMVVKGLELVRQVKHVLVLVKGYRN